MDNRFPIWVSFSFSCIASCCSVAFFRLLHLLEFPANEPCSSLYFVSLITFSAMSIKSVVSMGIPANMQLTHNFIQVRRRIYWQPLPSVFLKNSTALSSIILMFKLWIVNFNADFFLKKVQPIFETALISNKIWP